MENETALIAKAGTIEATPGQVKSLHDLALEEHWAILESWKRLGENWLGFVKRVQDFKKDKLYREIIDPETRAPFTRFDTWAERYLGKSASSVFAQMQLARELIGVVPTEKLATMKRHNAHELVRLKKAHKEINDSTVTDAVELTHTEFVARHGINTAWSEQQQIIGVCELGPFQVTSATATLFKDAIAAAKADLVQGGYDADDDAAIARIARVYLDSTIDAPVDQVLPEGTENPAATPIM
jgi:hypothetical protein